MKIVVDDLRDILNVDLICRSAEVALTQVRYWPDFSTLYLDNDLGEGKMEGFAFLKKLNSLCNWLPSKIILVSSNPVARENIRNFLRDKGYVQFFDPKEEYAESWEHAE